MNIPKIFWKYYDLFRRKEISLEEYSQKSGLTKTEIKGYLKEISKKE